MRAVDAVARLTGRRAVRARALSGAAVCLVEVADGAPVVAKDAPGRAAAEVAGLRWLAEPGAVPVPAVLGSDERWLVVEYVAPGHATAGAAAGLGRGLAGLHAAGAPAFGAGPPGAPADAWIGLAPMRNEPAPDWPGWYVEQRVEPYLRRAVDGGALDPRQAAVIDMVCQALPSIAGPAEPPARLHGDLWSGNVSWAANGTAWLLDPAAHGGHRETDLAMLALFGCPHLDRVLGAYQEIAPLAAGWRGRVGLHQLFPLLVHVVLFGRGYAAQAVAAARAALEQR